MKATRTPTKFVPLQLLLESQEEIDMLFALLNHSDLSRAVNSGEAQAVLLPYIDICKANELHANLCNVVK